MPDDKELTPQQIFEERYNQIKIEYELRHDSLKSYNDLVGLIDEQLNPKKEDN